MKFLLKKCLLNFIRFYCSIKSTTVFNTLRVKKVLVFAYTGLGNFVLYTPALRTIREFLPHASFTLLHGNDTGCQDMVKKCDLFDKYVAIKRDADWWTRVKWIYRLFKDKHDLVISEFHNNNLFMVLLAVLSGAQYRLGHVTSPGWSNDWDWVYNIPVRMKKDQHEIDRYMELAWVLEDKKSRRVPATFVHIEKRDKSLAESFLRSAGFKRGDKLICLHSGTSPAMRWKQWPIEKYKELCEKILEISDIKIVILGTANERNTIDQLLSRENERIIDAVGKTTVKQVTALIEHCDIFVGNDSGLAKISIALDTPTITIWGPSDYPRAKAWKPGHYDIRKDLDCSPCFRLNGAKKVENCPYNYKCLKLITVDEVFEAISNVLVKRAIHKIKNGAKQ